MIETLLKQILKLPQLSLDELEILHKSISKLEFNSNAPQVESIKKLVEIDILILIKISFLFLGIQPIPLL